MQVTVTIKTAQQQFPGGTVGGNWGIDYALADDPSNVVENYVGPAPSTTFDLPDGETVIFRAVRLDAAGVVIGPVATTQYTVGGDLISIDVASTIEATATPSTMKQGKAAGKK